MREERGQMVRNGEARIIFYYELKVTYKLTRGYYYYHYFVVPRLGEYFGWVWVVNI
jgi:hypothetical protein